MESRRRRIEKVFLRERGEGDDGCEGVIFVFLFLFFG